MTVAKFLIHIGSGKDRKTYAYEDGAVELDEAISIQGQLDGLGWQEFKEEIGRQSPLAIRALVWMLRRREEPDLPIDQVNFKWGDLDIEAVPEPKAPKEDSAEEVPPTAN